MDGLGESSSRRLPSNKMTLKEYSKVLPCSAFDPSLVTFRTKFHISPKTEKSEPVSISIEPSGFSLTNCA